MEGLSKQEKGLINKDNSVVMAGGREVGSAGVGWRDGEERHTTVIE